MSLRARLTSWLNSLGADKGDVADATAKRESWRAVAAAHGLTFQEGPHPGFFQDDRIVGEVMGRDVEVVVGFAYDIQKLIVQVSVPCNLGSDLEALSPHGLVAWYEARRESAGLAPMPEDLADWAAGRREGNGTYIRDRRLTYLQSYGISNEALELLLTKLPAWAAQLELASRVDEPR